MDSISLATESLQAQERLHLYLKRENKKTNQFKQTLDQSCIVLDTLRDMKSSLEGSSVQLESTSVCEDILVKIKTIMLMHTPQSLTKEDRETLVTLIKESFQDSCREVIFAAMITCPYYSWTQPERGQQAKHNSIFVVYVHKDQQFFAPVNPHVIESSQVIDKEWFYAAEAYHFAHFLCRGKVRCVEMLHLLSDAILYETEAWLRLKSTVSSHSMINLRGCLEQCRGMAAGSVGKKSKQTSKFQLRDTATLYDLCESCRLLGHADSILNKNSFQMVQLTDDSFEHESAKSALLKIKSMYQQHTTDKFEVFDVLMKWKSEIDLKLKGYTYTDQKDFSRGLGEWLVSVRKPHDKILNSLAVRDADSARLQELMALVGGPVLKIQPKNIILIARVGSYLYGLSTPESDADYTIIYAEDIQTLLSATTRIKSCTESRGPDKMFEYGAYEAQLFTEMLWKGSVSIAELLFVDDLEYTSDSWRELLNNREKFATEKLIMQYWGLIKNNITSIVYNKYKNQPKERKCFYQIFHKLDCVGDLLEGQCPQVRSQGKRREFIMHIRRGELEGEFSRDNLKEKALQMIDDLWDKLVQRKTRLPENVDYLYLQKWLMKVRGWET